VLAGIQGRFIMSINDVSEIRELFKDCPFEEVATNYKMPGAHKQKKVAELLIRNYA
jgi:DNA adenine methylase